MEREREGKRGKERERDREWRERGKEREGRRERGIGNGEREGGKERGIRNERVTGYISNEILANLCQEPTAASTGHCRCVLAASHGGGTQVLNHLLFTLCCHQTYIYMD